MTLPADTASCALKSEQDQYRRHRQSLARQAHQRLLAYELKYRLHRWGQFLEKTRDQVGLPTAAAFTRIPGSILGHRILCPDMPKPVYFMNQAVLRLEEARQFYIHAWYAWLHDEYGHWLEQSEKAKLMGMSYGQFKVEVHRSRNGLLKLSNFWAI